MKEPRSGAKKIIVGLTGSFGSGKSTVANFFKQRGAAVIDADLIARRLLSPGRPCYKETVRIFGGLIVGRNGRINRKKLSAIVFTDRRLLHRLNKVIHPEVIRVIKKNARQAGGKIVVIDAPLLLEAGLSSYVDKLIVVTIRRDKQFKRLGLKRHLEKKDILNRIRAQLPLSLKVRSADFIIDNNGSLGGTKRQAEEVWRKILVLVEARDGLCPAHSAG
jgi:dephospho-CoA kinase